MSRADTLETASSWTLVALEGSLCGLPKLNAVTGIWRFPCGWEVTERLVVDGVVDHPVALGLAHDRHHKAGHEGNWILTETVSYENTKHGYVKTVTIGCGCE